MSDYLNNLVARTLNFAPVVQPRLASLFESGVNAGVMSSASVETEPPGNEPSAEPNLQEPFAIPTNVQISQGRPQVRERMEVNATDRERTGAEHDAAERTDTGSAGVHPLPALIATSELRPPVVFRGASPKSETVRSHQPAGKQVIAPEAAANVSVQSTIERDREETRPRLQPGIQQLIDERLTRLSPEPQLENERTKPAQSGPVSVSTFLKTPVRPEVVAIKPPPLNIHPPVATEPEQTVNVTIGRVDVRAVFPAPVETPRRPTAPRHDPAPLAEYLKKRERGRR